MVENLNKAPLAEAISAYIAKQPSRFHMPGHHGKAPSAEARAALADIWQTDLTEVTGLDILAAPEGAILEAEKACAKLCRAQAAYFLVNGATVGLQAAILAACARNEDETCEPEILVPRNAHRSVWGALALAGAKPVWLPVYHDKRYGIPLGVDPEAVNRAVLNHPRAKAVLYVYPTYHGLCNELKAMLRPAAEHSMYTIVDEAHGAHFNFTGCPAAAIGSGATAVVQGWHKTMGSLTQTGVLLLNDPSLQVDKYLGILQSSSPSYPLMASLDLARANWQAHGHTMAARLFANATKLRTVIASVDIFQVLGAGSWPWPVAGYDNSRVVIVSRQGHSGWQIAQALETVGIYPEMADAATVTFIAGFNDTEADITGLLPKFQAAGAALASVEPKSMPVLNDFPMGQMAVLPRVALKTDSEYLALAKAVGRISAGLVVPYPPGIPLVGLGEIITEDMKEILEYILAEGGRIQGLREGQVSVIK